MNPHDQARRRKDVFKRRLQLRFSRRGVDLDRPPRDALRDGQRQPQHIRPRAGDEAVAPRFKVFDGGGPGAFNALQQRNVLLERRRLAGFESFGAAFLETLIGHLLVAGNAYAEAASIDNAPRELHALRPDRMKVVPGGDGWPEAYDYSVGAEIVRFRQDAEVPPVLHIAFFHPLDDHYGLSPLEAAAQALDVHNAASSWNKALLDNAARPSGALVYSGADGANLSEEQFARLKEELEDQFSGPRNAGRPLLLDGGLDWKAMGLTPRDMDFIEAKNAASRDIALAFGVPPMMLGLPGDNTFANYQEANRAFYRLTVLPLVERIAQELGGWLEPRFGRRLKLGYDADRIEGLSAEREALWARVSQADFLTDDEKREAVGYGSRRPR